MMAASSVGDVEDRWRRILRDHRAGNDAAFVANYSSDSEFVSRRLTQRTLARKERRARKYGLTYGSSDPDASVSTPVTDSSASDCSDAEDEEKIHNFADTLMTESCDDEQKNVQVSPLGTPTDEVSNSLHSMHAYKDLAIQQIRMDGKIDGAELGLIPPTTLNDPLAGPLSAPSEHDQAGETKGHVPQPFDMIGSFADPQKARDKVLEYAQSNFFTLNNAGVKVNPQSEKFTLRCSAGQRQRTGAAEAKHPKTCPWSVDVRYNKPNAKTKVPGRWIFTNLTDSHNHSLEPPKFKELTHESQIPAHWASYIQGTLDRMKASPRALKILLLEKGLNITEALARRIIARHQTKILQKQLTTQQWTSVMHTLRARGHHFEMDVDDTGLLLNSFHMTELSLKFFLSSPEVILADCTYNIVDKDYVVIDLVGITNDHRTFIIAWGYLSGETIEIYKWFFRHFVRTVKAADPNILDRCRVFMTDGEVAFRSILPLFPSARHQLCLWHLLKNIRQKWKKLDYFYPKDAEGKRPALRKGGLEKKFHEFVKDWLIMVKQRTVEAFTNAKSDLFLKWPAIAETVRFHLSRYGMRFLHCFTSHMTNFGMQSTQRIESVHQKVKANGANRHTTQFELVAILGRLELVNLLAMQVAAIRNARLDQHRDWDKAVWLSKALTAGLCRNASVLYQNQYVIQAGYNDRCEIRSIEQFNTNNEQLPTKYELTLRAVQATQAAPEIFTVFIGERGPSQWDEGEKITWQRMPVRFSYELGDRFWCSCCLPTQWLVPCSHVLYVLNSTECKTKLPIAQLFGQRWFEQAAMVEDAKRASAAAGPACTQPTPPMNLQVFEGMVNETIPSNDEFETLDKAVLAERKKDAGNLIDAVRGLFAYCQKNPASYESIYNILKAAVVASKELAEADGKRLVNPRTVPKAKGKPKKHGSSAQAIAKIKKTAENAARSASARKELHRIMEGNPLSQSIAMLSQTDEVKEVSVASNVGCIASANSASLRVDHSGGTKDKQPKRKRSGTTAAAGSGAGRGRGITATPAHPTSSEVGASARARTRKRTKTVSN